MARFRFSHTAVLLLPVLASAKAVIHRPTATTSDDYPTTTEEPTRSTHGYEDKGHSTKKERPVSSDQEYHSVITPTPSGGAYESNRGKYNTEYNTSSKGGGCQCTINVYPSPVYFDDIYTVHPESTAYFASQLYSSQGSNVEIQYVTAAPTSVVTYGGRTATLTAGGDSAVVYSLDMYYGDSQGEMCTPTKSLPWKPVETLVYGGDGVDKCTDIPSNNCATSTMLQEASPPRTKTVVCQLSTEATGVIPGNNYHGSGNGDSQGGVLPQKVEVGGDNVKPAGPGYNGNSGNAPPASSYMAPAPTPPAPAPASGNQQAAAAPPPPPPPPPPPTAKIYNDVTKVLSSVPTKAQDNLIYSGSAGCISSSPNIVRTLLVVFFAGLVVGGLL